MELKKKVVIRYIGDEAVLIPVGKTVNEYNGVFSLTPTAATAFSALSSGADRNGIIETLLNEYDASEEQIQKDVDDFLKKLTEYGII